MAQYLCGSPREYKVLDIFNYQKSFDSFPYCIRGTFVWIFTQVREVEHEDDFCYLFLRNLYLYLYTSSLNIHFTM